MVPPDWDPVMLTIYLNEMYAESPRSFGVSSTRRQTAAKSIVVDLRNDDRSEQQHDRSEGSRREHIGPEPLDIYSTNH